MKFSQRQAEGDLSDLLHLEDTDEFGRTALIDICSRRQERFSRIQFSPITEKNEDDDESDGENESTLKFSENNEEIDFDNDESAVRALLGARSCATAQDDFGRTALMEAVRHGKLDVIKVLLKTNEIVATDPQSPAVQKPHDKRSPLPASSSSPTPSSPDVYAASKVSWTEHQPKTASFSSSSNHVPPPKLQRQHSSPSAQPSPETPQHHRCMGILRTSLKSPTLAENFSLW